MDDEGKSCKANERMNGAGGGVIADRSNDIGVRYQKNNKHIQKVMQNSKQSGQFKKLKWTLQNRAPGYPCKRWGHTTVVCDKSLLIYGGNHSGNPKEGLYKIDCQTLEASYLLYEHMPPVRESHTCNLIKDSIFVYGGCINQELTNDLLLFKVSDNNNYWKKIEQKNPIPPRQSHVSLALTYRHILIYGGTTPAEEILDDFWIIDLETGIWQQIKNIKGLLQPKIGCTITMIQSNIYAFGGEFEENQQSQFTNDVYTLQFQSTNYTNTPPPSLTINKLEVIGIRPSARTGHCCIDYKGKFMIIIGGEGVSSKNAPVLYNDIWLFDLKNYQWLELIVQNRSNFKPRSNFTANLYKNTIFIFGGFINLASFKSTDEFVTLTLYQNKPSLPNPIINAVEYESKSAKATSQYCLTCKFQFMNYVKPSIQAKFEYKPINNALYCNYSNVYRTAKTISSPFEALSLLLNTIGNLPGSDKKQINVSLQKTAPFNHKNGYQDPKQDFSETFLSIFASGISLTKKELQLLIYLYNFDSYELGFDLKSSLLRLGKQFLLSYVFVDDMIHLYYFLNNNIYHFIFHTNALAYEIAQKVQYSTLLQFVKHYKIDISSLFKKEFNLFIGSLHKINSAYEMKEKPEKGDIQCEVKNVKMLFSEYIKEYFFEKIPIVLYFRNQRVPLIAYSKSLHNEKHIEPATASFSRISLELDQQPLVLYPSPFIKVYFGNRRVGIFNKYPFISGYLCLKDGSSLNFARTRCESWQVRDDLQKQVQNALEMCKKREANKIPNGNEQFYAQQIQ